MSKMTTERYERRKNVKEPNATCGTCGRKFWVRPRDLRRGFGNYCSRVCRDRRLDDGGLSAKVELLTMNDVQKGREAYRLIAEECASMVADLGGEEMVSTARMALIERAAVLSGILRDFETRLFASMVPAEEGGEVQRIALDDAEMLAYARILGVQRQLLASIGLERRAKDVSVPGVHDYLASKVASKRGNPDPKGRHGNRRKNGLDA